MRSSVIVRRRRFPTSPRHGLSHPSTSSSIVRWSQLGAIKSIKSVPLRSFINAYSNHFYISSTGKRVFLNRGA